MAPADRDPLPMMGDLRDRDPHSGDRPHDWANLEDRIARRRAALRDLSGMFTGAYPPGYLAALHAEWPGDHPAPAQRIWADLDPAASDGDAPSDARGEDNDRIADANPGPAGPDRGLA